jgi:hypothetical protein
LTLTGANDVIFQGGFAPGGSSGSSIYPYSYILHSGSGYILFNEATEILLLDSGPSPLTPVWVDPQATQNMAVFAIAFTAAGASNLPGPPTGLTAIVN